MSNELSANNRLGSTLATEEDEDDGGGGGGEAKREA
jgi:hypothetical protein